MEYIELTDKGSTLRGPPGTHCFFRVPVLTLVWFWRIPTVPVISHTIDWGREVVALFSEM